MDSGLETALVSASIAAVVSVSIAFISPLFTHHLWNRQKRKEQQLAIAERYAVLRAEISASAHFSKPRVPFETSPARMELQGLLFVIPVLFKTEEVISRVHALGLQERGDQNKPLWMVRYELQAYLFAEALNVPFDKVPIFPEKESDE
jgi:hypothetical protein